MEKTTLKKGDVVQLGEAKNKAFTGCFMTVTDPKEFGAQGFVQGIGNTKNEIGGRYYYRASWEEMEFVGSAAFMPIDEVEENEEN